MGNISLDSILQKLFCKLVQSKELLICILLASFTLEKDLLFILLWSFTPFCFSCNDCLLEQTKDPTRFLAGRPGGSIRDEPIVVAIF